MHFVHFVHFVHFEKLRFFKKRGQNVDKIILPPIMQFYDRKFSLNASLKNNPSGKIKKEPCLQFCCWQGPFNVLL